VQLHNPRRIIVCDKDPVRLKFVRDHYPTVLTVGPEQVSDLVQTYSNHGGADVVLEVAGSEESFRMAWECARPNATVTIVALYDGPQTLPLPEMYGKNLTFKTGGVDGCNCDETLRLISEGKLDTTPLITHTYPLKEIEAAYELFEARQDGVIKVAVKP
jgi:threonine dehydrogenase-like Zn-dependent dehydrogenase